MVVEGILGMCRILITDSLYYVSHFCDFCGITLAKVHVARDRALSVVVRRPAQFLINSTLFTATAAKYIMNAFAEIN